MSKINVASRVFLVCGFAAMDGCGTAPSTTASQSEALTASEACTALAAFKAKNSEATVSANDDLAETYRALLAQCGGRTKDHFIGDLEEALSADVELATNASPDQLVAMREVHAASFRSIPLDDRVLRSGGAVRRRRCLCCTGALFDTFRGSFEKTARRAKRRGHPAC
jgi:hypothetical protein